MSVTPIVTPFGAVWRDDASLSESMIERTMSIPTHIAFVADYYDYESEYAEYVAADELIRGGQLVI